MSGHYKIGDRVRVLNQTFGGKNIFEGWATIKRLLGDNRYMVRFDGDGPRDLFERRVTPEMETRASEIWS